ncbi:MAG TPA: 16S rRNA (cytidine(1402)-2'-O)-methyltransferase [Streptosporangiaceae bacterium]|nr:16S rRNA (cytidine(1402)-2'-O)-methyltransferase [Streptosporangiaceae bacterium]
MKAGFHDSDDPGTPGTLILAAAPIGRPQDAPASLAAALAAAPVIAAEDTRRLPRLARALGVTFTGRLVSYYEGVEDERAPALLAALAAGQDVLLITDAGTPGISDPGYRLVKAAVEARIRVTVLAGPSAVTAALAVSGLPSDRFCFEGFPPRKAGERVRRLGALREETRTMVFFESPRRLAVTLNEMAGAFGAGRQAAVCRELTKTHEEVRRGTLGELANWAAGGVLGEITVVVGGATKDEVAGTAATIAEAVERVAEAERAGLSRREAVASVAAETGLRRRAVYNAVLADHPGRVG